MKSELKNKKRILVIGSSNMDMVAKVDRFPTPGETILGGRFLMNPGGKGANQAVAVSRLGGSVDFITKLGNDSIGEEISELFKSEGLDTRCLLKDDQNPTGVAIITVDKHAENSIVVASGANANLTPKDIELLTERIRLADFVLLQLEIPLKTIKYVVDLAYSLGKKVIVNPAPFTKLPKSIFIKLYLITPNQIEAEMLSGIKINNEEDCKQAAREIYKLGAKNVVITLGASGAFIFNGEGKKVNAQKIEAIDTTAAGDVFNGGLLVALSEGLDMEAAVHFASKAAAIAVSRQGAIRSIPYRNEMS